MTPMDNVDTGEVEKFAARAAEWWDPAGAFRTLHEEHTKRAKAPGGS